MGKELAGGGEKSTPGGLKKEAPGIKFRPPGVKFRPPGSSKWASGLLLGRLGRQVGLWRTLGGKGGVGKLYVGLLGPSWGSLGASWARFGSIFFPRGGAGRVILKVFWGLPGREAKTEHFQIFECFFGPISLLYVVLCCLPCCVAGGTAHIQKT